MLIRNVFFSIFFKLVYFCIEIRNLIINPSAVPHNLISIFTALCCGENYNKFFFNRQQWEVLLHRAPAKDRLMFCHDDVYSKHFYFHFDVLQITSTILMYVKCHKHLFVFLSHFCHFVVEFEIFEKRLLYFFY